MTCSSASTTSARARFNPSVIRAEIMLAELGGELVKIGEIEILELLLDPAQLGGGDQFRGVERAVRRLDQLGRKGDDLVVGQVVDLAILRKELDLVAEQEPAHAALTTVAKIDAPALVLGVHDETRTSGPEDTAEGLTARFRPGHCVGDFALGFDHFLGEPALFVLGGGQCPHQAPVFLQKIVAAFEPDQAAVGSPGDIATDLDDVVFQLADALGGLELGQALEEHVAHAVAMRRVPEIQHGVVADGEGRPHRVERPGGDAQRLAEGEPRRIGHDHVAVGVHAAAPGPAGHLLELVRDEHARPPAVPLAHPADDDRARGHVDAEREGVGGEDDLHQPAARRAVRPTA